MTEFEHALLAEFPAQELALPTSDPRYELAAAAVLVALECVFQCKSTSDSDSKAPLVPIQTCQLFQFKTAIQS
jgi:hypothetical protein